MELRLDHAQLFFDTGTGFRQASISPLPAIGNRLIDAENQPHAFVFYSHFHHDHIQGLAFNPDLFRHSSRIVLASALSSGTELYQQLKRYYSGSYFSLDILANMPDLQIRDISAISDMVARRFRLSWIKLRHPGGSYGYRIDAGGKRFCYLCDNEYHALQYPELADFTAGADMVVWDGMFTDDEMKNKTGWGHSSIQQGITFFQQADIKQLMISHHAPYRHDHDLADFEKNCPDGVIFARDRLTIIIE